MAAIWHGSASQRLGKLTPDMDGRDGRKDRCSGQTCQRGKEGETPKGDGKLFDFFLLFLSLSLSVWESRKCGPNTERVATRIVPVPVRGCTFKQITVGKFAGVIRCILHLASNSDLKKVRSYVIESYMYFLLSLVQVQLFRKVDMWPG